MYEICLNSKNNIIMVEDLNTGETKPLPEMGYSFLKNADDAICRNYPQCYEELEQLYGEGKEKMYGRVRQFFACNFTAKDGHPDIDDDWNYIIEGVACPARLSGICKFNFCTPELSHNISDREVEVLSLFAKGFDEEEIATALFISKNTVHNHVNNMYRKIGVVGKSSPDRKLVNYAHLKGII